MDQEILLEITFDDIAFDCHAPFERTQLTLLAACDGFHACDRLAAKRNEQRFPVFLHILQHLDALGFELRNQHRFHTPM